MTEKDLIIYLYEGFIGANQMYNLNNLRKDGYNIDYFTKRKIEDPIVCAKIESLIRSGKNKEAKEVFDRAADSYAEYEEMQFYEMLEAEKEIPWKA